MKAFFWYLCVLLVASPSLSLSPAKLSNSFLSLRPVVVSELGFGATYNVTENTLKAFSLGIRRGATAIEFTSRRTLDGQVALLHNALVSSTERAMIIFPDKTNNVGSFIIGKAVFSAKYGGQETGAVTLDIAYSAGPSGIVTVGI